MKRKSTFEMLFGREEYLKQKQKEKEFAKYSDQDKLAYYSKRVNDPKLNQYQRDHAAARIKVLNKILN